MARQRDLNRTRERIMAAALKEFAASGFAGARTDAIACRARVNERMDWLNTNHYREWAYHLIYPQVFPGHVRASENADINRPAKVSPLSSRPSKAIACEMGPS